MKLRAAAPTKENPKWARISPNLSGVLHEDIRMLGVDRLTVGQVAEHVRRHGHSVQFHTIYNITVRPALEERPPAWRRKSTIAETREYAYSIPISGVGYELGHETAFLLVSTLHPILVKDGHLAEELAVKNEEVGIVAALKREFSKIIVQTVGAAASLTAVFFGQFGDTLSLAFSTTAFLLLINAGKHLINIKKLEKYHEQNKRWQEEH